MLARGSVNQERLSEALPALLPRACLGRAGRVCGSGWAGSQAAKASACKFSSGMTAPAPSFLSRVRGAAQPHRWRRQSWTFSAPVFCSPCGSGCFSIVILSVMIAFSQPPGRASRHFSGLFLGSLTRAVNSDDDEIE